MFSQAAEVSLWVQRRHIARRCAAIAYLVISLTFILWRGTILNWEAPVLAVIFYLLEWIGLLMGWGMIYSSWWHQQRTSLPITRTYTVDVLLPVYTEPLEMIELTVIGAKSIDYPHETYLLDDGHREDLRALAAKHGIHYLSREGNKGMKAGNLNHGLQHSRGEIVAVFDADHVAQRESLEKMLGFFADEKVGLVQAPQTYFNEDAFIYSKTFVASGYAHEQSYFFDLGEGSRDAFNAASGIGTGALYRRTALAEIGGFPEQTMTEDIHSSILLSKHGWTCAYFNEPVAWGVAAADVPEYYRTRRRWAHGNLEAFRLEKLPFNRRIPLKSRLAYSALAVQYLDGVQQLGFLIIPVWSMISYDPPFILNFWNIVFALCTPLLLIWLTRHVTCGYISYYRRQVFSIGRFHLMLAALPALWGKRLRWHVAVKNVIGIVNWGMLTPQILLLILAAGAILVSGGRLLWFLSTTGHLPPQYLATFFACGWMTYNIVRLCDWIRGARRLNNRKARDYLFEVRAPLVDATGCCVAFTTHLSHLELKTEQPLPGECPLRLLLPGEAISILPQAADADGIRAYQFVDEDQRMSLQLALYSVDWHRQLRLAPLCQTTHPHGLGGPWQPAALGGAWAAWMQDGDGLKIVSAEPLVPGQALDFRRETGPYAHSEPVVIQEEIQPPYKIPRDVNGHQCRIFKARPR